MSRIAMRIRCSFDPESIAIKWFCMLMIGVACVQQTASAQVHDASMHQFTFSWPFSSDDVMRPRGGTSQGANVQLDKQVSSQWIALQEQGISKFERDRRAILAMAGAYRTSFDFIETIGFEPGFEPARPYQSWGTEYIYVVEDSDQLISLQHILVMSFIDPDGNPQGPFVQKHWRQDWQYEDDEYHAYVGGDRFERHQPEIAGGWSQAVYQVDDSPRYASSGYWAHTDNFSMWESKETWRPLPRRESSVRSDYDFLIGVNRHTILPNGWVQEEDNFKTLENVETNSLYFLAKELGINRYERLRNFDVRPADEYWRKTEAFWADVRAGWNAVFDRYAVFDIEDEIDGQALWQHMFEYAANLDGGEEYNARASRRFVRKTLNLYIEESVQ